MYVVIVCRLVHILQYNSQKILPLENVRIQSHPDMDDLSNGWQIISPSKSFVVFAATATEKTEWMAHINKCVQDLLNKSTPILSYIVTQNNSILESATTIHFV